MAEGSITNFDLLAAIQKSGENLQSQIKELKAAFETNKIANDEEIINLKTKIQEHDNQFLRYEMEARKRNIIIHGIKETERNRKELEDIIISLFNEVIKTDIKITEIDAIFRLGSKKDKDIRPVIVKFLSQRRVWDVLQNRKFLKGKNIFINEDLPKPIVEKRKELYPLMKELRDKGETAYMKYDKLISNGKIINPAEIELETKSTATNGKKRTLSEEDQIETEHKQKEQGTNKKINLTKKESINKNKTQKTSTSKDDTEQRPRLSSFSKDIRKFMYDIDQNK